MEHLSAEATDAYLAEAGPFSAEAGSPTGAIPGSEVRSPDLAQRVTPLDSSSPTDSHAAHAQTQGMPNAVQSDASSDEPANDNESAAAASPAHRSHRRTRPNRRSPGLSRRCSSRRPLPRTPTSKNPRSRPPPQLQRPVTTRHHHNPHSGPATRTARSAPSCGRTLPHRNPMCP